jgi:hypothetical protein
MLASFITVAALIAVPVPLATQPFADIDLSSTEMYGTIGSYRVGLNYTVRNRTELVRAHYFYASQLKDIPLTGALQGEAVDLKGEDGSIFRLHFVGNGSNGAEPLTFYNSVGLTGILVLGSRTLPVNLTGEHGTSNPGQRLYENVTSQPDAEFEAMIQAARRAILRGDPNLAAKYVHFPLRVNIDRKHLMLQNPAQLEANWPRVFSPAFIAKLRKDIPHEMFVHEGEAMLGQGHLWFDDKGLTVVNAE